MIRPARFGDVPGIFALFQEMYRASPYVGQDAIDERHTKALIVSSIQRHGALSDGGTLVLVSECEGVIKGFVIGILDRVYHIGTKLMATDLFTFNSPDGDPRDGLRLIDGLIAWAESNPAVIEIKLGAVDAVGDFERTAKVFRRRGLKQSGVIYQRSIKR